MAVRKAILDHMVRSAHLLLYQHIRSSHTSVQSYIASSKIGVRGIWGTETEMLALAHKLLAFCRNEMLTLLSSHRAC